MHSTIGMTSSAVKKSNEVDILLRLSTRNVTFDEPKYMVGDRVSINNNNSTFANEYKNNWSKQIPNPPTYKINDLDNEKMIGSFYNNEINFFKLFYHFN